ncbi:MAG TPA: hypothetical protein VLM75_01940 [Spirochaetota bacterium]|nr:hypothetical protein [Spirochaetota bacterium]
MYQKIAGLLFITALALPNGCGTGKYTDIKSVMCDIIEVRGRFVANVKQAKTPKEAADALTAFGTEMKKLGPRYEELEKKYPELQNPDSLPLELKKLVDNLTRTAEQRDAELTNLLMLYPDNPVVQKALASIGSVYK